MKKVFLILVAAAFLGSVTAPAFAAGGKWHGTRWEGGETPAGVKPGIKQNQVQVPGGKNVGGQGPKITRPDYAGPDNWDRLLDPID